MRMDGLVQAVEQLSGLLISEAQRSRQQQEPLDIIWKRISFPHCSSREVEMGELPDRATTAPSPGSGGAVAMASGHM